VSLLEGAVYPVMIDPTVVVNAAYDTSGNGGRKIVELANGWVVCVVYDSSTYYLYFYKSADVGNTWGQLCYIDGGGAINDFAIAKAGNIVHWMLTQGSVCLGKYFDATTVTNTDQAIGYKYIDSGQITTGNCSLIVDSNGDPYAAWSSKNATYPNSDNIRYNKSTDGGANWAAVTQISMFNNGSYNAKNPCIAINGSGNPVIACAASNTGGAYAIVSYVYTDSWSVANQICYINGYDQNYPSAKADSTGMVHVVWHGVDATDAEKTNIRYSKAADGGATWSAAIKLTTGNSYDQQYPSIAVDDNNKLYVFFQGRTPGIYYQIRKITYDGSAWGSIVDITAQTSANATSPAAMAAEVGDIIGYIWMDAEDSDVKFDKIVLNVAPLAPTGLICSNFDATTDAIFSWTYNDPGDTQTAYQLIVYKVSDGSTVKDTGKVVSANSNYTLSANTLTNGNQYQWKVKTWDSLDLDGPYSALQTVTVAAAPSVSVTYPTGIIPTSSVTATWTVSGGQAKYQVVLTDSSDTVLWDSGQISDANARSKTVTYDLSNSTNYKITVQVWDSSEIASAIVTQQFTTSFTVPVTPTITATAGTSYITVAITNPAETPPEPAVSNNDLYRRISGATTWTRIKMGIAENGSYADYAVASGVTYEYKARANGDNSTTADSATASISITLSGVWLHDVVDPAGTVKQLRADGGGRSADWQATAALLQFDGRTYSVAEFGTAETNSVSATIQMTNASGDLAVLETLVQRKATLCYRDRRGRKIFGVITSLPVAEERSWGYTVTVRVDRVDYTEAV
jgi:hypothetical protein